MSGLNLKNEPSDQYYSENGGDMHSSSFYNNSNDGFIIKEEYEDVEDPSQILPDCNMYLSEDEHSENSEASIEQPSTSKRQKMSRDGDGLEYVNSEKPPYQRREKVQRSK